MNTVSFQKSVVQVDVGPGDSIESTPGKFANGGSVFLRWCVGVINDGNHQKLLSHIAIEDISASGTIDEAQKERFKTACHLIWNSVKLANIIPPVVPLHREDGKIGQDICPLDGSGYLLWAVSITKTNVTVIVPYTSKSLEPAMLASQFLRWLDF